jgi:hypothetical protein
MSAKSLQYEQLLVGYIVIIEIKRPVDVVNIVIIEIKRPVDVVNMTLR